MKCTLCEEEFRRDELRRCDEGCCLLCLECDESAVSLGDVPCVAGKVELRQLRAEVERLRESYRIFEELAPPDVPRAVFVEWCFNAWEKQQEAAKAAGGD